MNGKLTEAVKKGFIDAETAPLLELQECLNEQDKAGCTPLMWAVHGRNKELVELLIKKGADAQMTNHTKSTALRWAEFYHQDDIAEILKDAANIRQRYLDERMARLTSPALQRNLPVRAKPLRF